MLLSVPGPHPLPDSHPRPLPGRVPPPSAPDIRRPVQPAPRPRPDLTPPLPPAATPLRRACPWASAPDRGQATAEYALVILGAALIAVLLVAWATAGGGAGKIGRLFDAVVDRIMSHI